MQRAVDRMSKACNNFQLTISTKKTEVVHQPAPGKPYSELTITVNGQKLQVVDKLVQKTQKRTGQFFKKLFILQLQLPYDILLANIKIGLMRMVKKLSCFEKKNTACTRHIKMILALYQRRLRTTRFVRQSKTGSVTCKTPG